MRGGRLVGLFGALTSILLPTVHRLDRVYGGRSVPAPAVVVSLEPSGTAGMAKTPQSFGTATTAITVDVVVQDKRHKPVTDLARADFELTEDGVRQDLAE